MCSKPLRPPPPPDRPPPGPPSAGPPSAGPPKISLFFFPLLPQFLFFSPSLSCETPAAPTDRAAGARTRQPENSKRAHLRVPALQTTNIPRKRPKKLWREREKKARNFGAPTLQGHPSGPPTLRGPTLRGPTLGAPQLRALTFSGFGPPPFGAPPFRGPTLSGPPPFRGPTLRGPTLRGPTLRGSHFFWVWPPTLAAPQ